MHTRFLQYNLQILRSGELKTLGVHTRGTCRPLQPLQIAESADVKEKLAVLAYTLTADFDYGSCALK